jgi:hypothetical protein
MQNVDRLKVCGECFFFGVHCFWFFFSKRVICFIVVVFNYTKGVFFAPLHAEDMAVLSNAMDRWILVGYHL